MICSFETTHYVFHFLQSSLAAHDIAYISETQESCYEKICGLLNIRYAHKISYWLYDSSQVIGNIFFDGSPCNGVAITTDSDEDIGRMVSLTGRDEDRFVVEPYSVHAVYEERIKCIGEHEDTHVIAAQLYEPESAFLTEGLAMFMDGKWWGTANKSWAKDYSHKEELLSTADVMCLDEDGFYALESSKTYPVAGAWTEYVIGCYGVEKYKEFYCSKDYRKSAEKIFGRTLQEIHEDFVRWLS